MKMKNIIRLLRVLAFSITVMSASPTDLRSSDTPLDAAASIPPSLTSSESVTHEVTDIIDVNDTLSSRLGTRTVPDASPKIPAGTPPPAEAAVHELAYTDLLQELTTRISTEVDTTVPQQVNAAIPQEEEEGDTASPQKVVSAAPHEVNTAVPEEDTDAAASLEVTTWPSVGREVNEGARGSAVVTPGKSSTVPTSPGQLVKCHCGGQEVLTPSGCQRFHDTLIHGERSHSRYMTKSVADLNVVVHDLHCDVEDDHRELKFTKGQFYLRNRGDIILVDEAGYLSGLRINNYCVTHHLDDQGHLTWTMKACVPPPSVPTCCPPGQALKGGVCHPARTPDLLTPLIATGPKKESLEWPVIRNHHNPISCTSDPLKTIPLPTEKSYLMALPTGIIHAWLPSESIIIRKFTFPLDFCVDARQNLDRSVEYYANLCYSNPKDLHHKICDGSVCVRKCCKVGEIFNPSIKCSFANATFEPPFKTTPQYKTVIGFPLCAPQIQVKGIFVNKRGYLAYNGKTFPPTDYCVEKLSDDNGKVDDVALACIITPSKWYEILDIIFPSCQIISIIFLSLTVVCYCMVPVLMQNGGWYQLCHIVSLLIAYSSQVTQHVFVKSFDDFSCIAIALVMQLSFLATFFWLSVLCFEVWRKIRSLNKLIPPSSMPVWVYPLYAFGGPFTIGVITAGMQYLAPDNVPGVIKPYLGVTKCWFIDEIELFLYFYGPIAFLFACNSIFLAHTYWNYKKIEENSEILRDMTGGNTSNSNNTVSRTTLEQRHRRRDYVSDFKQQFSLMVLMSTCWVAEVLSLKIPPLEMWCVTDVLNSLQGFFMFIIFLANRNKRTHLKKKFPGLSMAAKKLKLAFQKVKSFILCKDVNVTSLFPINFMTSQISRKVSSSSIVSNLSTLSQRLSSVTSSFHVTSDENEDNWSPSIRESENGIITLSHSQLSSSSGSDNDTSC